VSATDVPALAWAADFDSQTIYRPVLSAGRREASWPSA
jgi:hypothetical protein